MRTCVKTKTILWRVVILKKLFIGKIPWIKIYWKTIDLRKWYYVWIDDEPCSWWACECELQDVKRRYPNAQFKKISFFKTILG